MKLRHDAPIEDSDTSQRTAFDFGYPQQHMDRPLALPPWSGNSEPMDKQIYEALVADLERDGFKRGAIVVNTRVKERERIDPANWGAIISFIHPNIRDKNPVRVKWMSGSYENCTAKELKLVYTPTWADHHILEARLSDVPQTALNYG